MREQILALVTLVSTFVLPVSQTVSPPVFSVVKTQILAEHELDLNIREPNSFANEVFADNILLALKYLGTESFVLQPGEVFAFHANVLPEFSEPAVTMNSKFYIEEGYKSIAGLGGNGVCHLASLINWTASEAGLEVVAKANHGFAPIPGVPKEFGTSIRSQSPNQNLYIKNNFSFPVTFLFQIEGAFVNLKILM